jgi:hypothetical protein
MLPACANDGGGGNDAPSVIDTAGESAATSGESGGTSSESGGTSSESGGTTSESDGTGGSGGDCVVAVDVDNPGDAIPGAYALSIDVSPFLGAADDLSNVRVFDSGGTELPRWVAHADAAAGKIWVAVSDLPAGASALSLDACDIAASPGSAGDVFAFHEDFGAGLGARSDIRCERVDETGVGSGVYLDGEECTIEHETSADGDGYLRAALRASCFADPYDGAAAVVSTRMDLDPGDYKLLLNARMSGEHYAYCPGVTAMAVWGGLDAAGWVVSESCSMSGCGTCGETDWRTMESAAYALLGGPVVVTTMLESGDCSQGEVDLTSVSVTRHVDPAPIATQVSES